MSVQAISWVLDFSKARLGAKLVLISIANHAKSDGTGAWPSVTTIGREAGLSPRHVIDLLPQLEALGELRIEKGKGPSGVHMYSLPLVPTPEKISGAEKSSGEIFAVKGTKGVKSYAGKPARISPEPSLRTVQKDNRPGVNMKIRNAADFLRRIKTRIKENGLGQQHQETWLPLMRRLSGIVDGILIVGVPSQTIARDCPETVKAALMHAMADLGEPVRGVKLVAEEERPS